MSTGRKPLSAKARFEVFKRDQFTCQYCGSHPPGVILHVDHIIAVAGGGGNDPDNLVTSCDRCNLGKGARPLSSVPMSLADKAEEAREREAQLAGYTTIMQAIRERIEDEAWQVAEALQPGARQGYNTAKFESIKRFVRDLGLHECLEAAEISWSRKPYSDPQRFKYFCGVCWNKIKRGSQE